jgi:hypothetical protein
MSIEGIISDQAASNLTDIVGTASVAAPDPGYDLACKIFKSTAGVNGLGLRFKNAKIDGHSVSSSIGANKSVTLDYTVQVDEGNSTFGAVSAGFYLEEITTTS